MLIWASCVKLMSCAAKFWGKFWHNINKILLSSQRCLLYFRFALFASSTYPLRNSSALLSCILSTTDGEIIIKLHDNLYVQRYGKGFLPKKNEWTADTLNGQKFKNHLISSDIRLDLVHVKFSIANSPKIAPLKLSSC